MVSSFPPQGAFWGRRWVYIVPVQHSKARVNERSLLKIIQLQQAPANVQLDQVNGDLLRITGIPKTWIDSLDEQILSVRTYACRCVCEVGHLPPRTAVRTVLPHIL